MLSVEEINGQIRGESRFGSWVSILAGAASVENVLEIGAWKGLGSTYLIAQAIKFKPHVQAISLEVNREFLEIARANLSGFDRPSLVYGTLVSPDILDRDGLSEQEQVWLDDDIRNISAAPNVLSQLPEEIHFLLLDGGEFSSWAEFQVLLPRVRGYLLLDDTEIRKNRRVHQFLANDDAWLLLDQGKDRNGWSVWAWRGNKK